LSLSYSGGLKNSTVLAATIFGERKSEGRKFTFSAIVKDIPKEFEDVDIILLEKLIQVFMTQPGQYLSLDELSKELQRAKTTLYKALFYLEYSFLIKKVLNYRPSIRSASRKLSRVYAYHPCLTLPFGISKEEN